MLLNSRTSLHSSEVRSESPQQVNIISQDSFIDNGTNCLSESQRIIGFLFGIEIIQRETVIEIKDFSVRSLRNNTPRMLRKGEIESIGILITEVVGIINGIQLMEVGKMSHLLVNILSMWSS